MSEAARTLRFRRETPRGEEPRGPVGHHELVILCIDVSASMGQFQNGRDGPTKADEIIQHLSTDGEGFLNQLRTSSHSNTFFLSIVTFDTQVTVREVSKVHDTANNTLLAITEQEFRSMFGLGSSTMLGRGLAAAGDIATTWLATEDGRRPVPRSATIIVLSDGQENAGTNPISVAGQIREQADRFPRLGLRPSIVIASAAYGNDADEATLQAIASRDAAGRLMYRKVRNGKDLRDFCMQSITL